MGLWQSALMSSALLRYQKGEIASQLSQVVLGLDVFALVSDFQAAFAVAVWGLGAFHTLSV